VQNHLTRWTEHFLC